MISFNRNSPLDDDAEDFPDDYDALEDSDINKLKKVLKDIVAHGTAFGEGSSHGGLSPVQIQKIISYLMYARNSSSILISIEKEIDEYHLNLTIESIEK